jgi:hypothetical protein
MVQTSMANGHFGIIPVREYRSVEKNIHVRCPHSVGMRPNFQCIGSIPNGMQIFVCCLFKFIPAAEIKAIVNLKDVH